VSLRQQAAQGALWLCLETLGAQGTSFVVFAVMARLVEPYDFGLMSVAFVVMFGIKEVIFDNIPGAIVRKQRGTDIEYSTAFWVTTLIGMLCCFAVVLLANVIEIFFHMPGLAPVLRRMSAMLMFMALGRTHEAWSTRHFRFRALALRSAAGSAAGAIVGIGLALRGLGVMALVSQQIAAWFVALVLLWTACSWRPSFRISAITVREICRYLTQIIPNGLIGLANANCDTVLIALFFGPAAVGIYNVGKRARLAVQFIATGPINGVALPALAEMQDDPARLRRGLSNALMLITAITGPIFFATAAIADELIKVLFGPKWNAAGPVLELLSLAGAAMALTSCCNHLFIVKRRAIWSLYLSSLYSILAVFGFFILTLLKSQSVVLPFVLPYIVVLPLSVALAARQVRLPLPALLRVVLPGIGSATVMFNVVRLADHQLIGSLGDWTRLACLAPLAAVVYAATLTLTSRATATMVVEALRPAFSNLSLRGVLRTPV
jgi:O-antigen/teichoic acid export membrane protein